MKKMFLLFSHTLTPFQIEDAKKNHGIERFVSLSDELQRLWSNVPANIENLDDYLKPLYDYLSKEMDAGDSVMIQGDFGAGYKMVNFVKEQGATALYATTKRDVVEKEVENRIVKTSIFEHVMFREY